MNKEQLLERIKQIREQCKPYAKGVLDGSDPVWYDECVRSLAHHQQHLLALELTLSLYDEITAND